MQNEAAAFASQGNVHRIHQTTRTNVPQTHTIRAQPAALTGRPRCFFFFLQQHSLLVQQARVVASANEPNGELSPTAGERLHSSTVHAKRTSVRGCEMNGRRRAVRGHPLLTARTHCCHCYNFSNRLMGSSMTVQENFCEGTPAGAPAFPSLCFFLNCNRVNKRNAIVVKYYTLKTRVTNSSLNT